jgi:membrane associated rhomboid family serine protease
MDYYRYNFLFKKAVNLLIGINLVCFVVFNLFPVLPWFLIFGLVPRYLFSRGQVWRLGTYLFVHASLWHVLVNMLMLWFFGPVLENIWGRRKFITFYLFTGLGAGLCSAVFAVGSLVPVVGASGAIFGILAAFAVLYPDKEVLLFFVFPVKMKYAVIFLVGINLWGALSSPGTDTAYLAHLGGGLLGLLYVKNKKLEDILDIYLWKKRLTNICLRQREKKRLEFKKETDRILDKISQKGIESLTEKEKYILKTKQQDSV